MNQNRDWSESTDKGIGRGTIKTASIWKECSERDPLTQISERSEDQQWSYHHPHARNEGRSSTESDFGQKYPQEKFTYYTFANLHANKNSSMSSTESYPISQQSFPQLPQANSYDGNNNGLLVRDMSFDTSNGNTNSRSTRSYRSTKSRSSRAFERRKRMETLHQHSGTPSGIIPPLLQIPEEIFAIRQAALTVMEPLTYGWPIATVGVCITAAFGIAYLLNLLPHLPFWFIMLPCWLAHMGIFVCHILSVRALTIFIAEANENRQREDSTDPFDRTEYLPILQRALKFGLKMGMISLSMLIFEILIYIRITKGSLSIARMLGPIWMIVVVGILNGIVCRTQRITSLFSWILLFLFMIFLVLRVDFQVEIIRLQIMFSPVIVLLGLSTFTLVYILYGYKIGYFQLTRAQAMAGLLYSISAIVALFLIVLIMNRIIYYPFDIGMKIFISFLVPGVVALVGFAAWSVNCDEFERLLQLGGQVTVYPMKLRFDTRGWTAMDSKGVILIPMLGDIRYEPLRSSMKKDVELCGCCSCYGYEDDSEQSMEPLTYSQLLFTQPSIDRALIS